MYLSLCKSTRCHKNSCHEILWLIRLGFIILLVPVFFALYKLVQDCTRRHKKFVKTLMQQVCLAHLPAHGPLFVHLVVQGLHSAPTLPAHSQLGHLVSLGDSHNNAFPKALNPPSHPHPQDDSTQGIQVHMVFYCCQSTTMRCNHLRPPLSLGP